MAGVDLLTISELMGHKTIQMTKRYAHLAPAYNQAAVDRLVSFQMPQASQEPEAAKQLERRARDGELAMVVTRQAPAWGIAEVRNRVVCYTRAAEARSAYLTPDSRGGQLILRALLRDDG